LGIKRIKKMVKKILDIFSRKKGKEEEKGKIVVDHREKNALVVSELIKLGYKVEFEQLDVGDYLVGRTLIERKTISDFKSSIVNKRIVRQLLELKKYGHGIMILEGIIEDDIYEGGIHENAFRGFLLSIILEFGVPLVYSYDSKDTAKYIDVLFRKKEKGDLGLRASKIFRTEEEQVQFILEGFPGIGPVVARKLVEKFGNLREIFSASSEELGEVLGKKADGFSGLLGYEGKVKKKGRK
jgi:ERCC4-type nuclease